MGGKSDRSFQSTRTFSPMSEHVRSWVQKIPATIDEVWAFFSSPANLPGITPPELNFRITGDTGAGPVHEGMVIDYTLTPLLMIPVEWSTVITKVSPPSFFEDRQLRGPYDEWQHRHAFRRIEGGVEMTDTVSYRLPFGALGDLVESLVLGVRLDEVFAFRRRCISEIFGRLD